MLIPSSTRSILLPKAPPFARRRGLRCAIANLVAQIRGARDLNQPFGENGLQPAVSAWHRQADQVAAQIDDALCSRLEELDRRSAELFGLANHRVSSIAELDATLQESAASAIDEGTVAASDNRRMMRSARATIEAERSNLANAAKELRQLAQTRQHLREAARDLADSWSSRCDELGAFHRRGFHFRAARAKVSSTPDAPPLPSHRNRYEWVDASDQTASTDQWPPQP
ncbi:hypothetical protein [Streptomyces sp. SID13031]|uniref:hypothetical protein n=1 Tax=Streptomyces sp. SID13031 TaxID=2706046 RepID=UPI0013C88FBE|nr:hypothetical protein [Streptomyces sp. SID13031]NEA32817.1 hypothetical protein [Streptomyces sp. SID13031]